MQAIYERLGAPSATQLYVAAVREGLQVSRKEAQEFVARQQETQLFAKVPESDSKTAIRSEKSDHMADLIDLKQLKSGLYGAILIVMNPFSRKIGMEVLSSKQPGVVASAYRTILNRMPKPQVLSTDQGQEFQGPFNALLEQKGIAHRLKDPRRKDFLAVLDRAIQKMKLILFKQMSRRNSTKWDGIVQEAQDGYNETINSELYGSPDDLEGKSEASKVAKFQQMKQQAANFEHNQEMAEKKANAVRDAGQFRVQLKQETFDRSFKPSYQTEIRQVREIRAGMVKDDSGRAAVPVSAVKPVPQGTIERPIPDFAGRGLRDNRLKEDLLSFARELYDGLGNEEVAVTRAARMMPPEFAEAKPSTLLMSQFLGLYPNLFKVTGKGPSMRVRRTGRRLRGKQPVR
jgi:hypothetical protein